MFSSSELYNKRVFVTNGKGARKKYGRIRSVVFHPSKLEAVGVIIKRPDMALMVKRKDRFVAFDRMEIREDGPLIIDQDDTWDKAACRRLGVDYEKCILWDYMPVKTTTGRELGTISTVFFDEGTFKIDHIDISTSSVSRKVLGASDITRDQIIGYNEGAIIVDESIGNVEASGGMAARAGEAWAEAKHKGTHAASAAGAKAADAVDKGAYGLGKAMGSVAQTATGTVEAVRAEVRSDERGAESAGERAGEHFEGRRASSSSASNKAARAVGQQLGRASGMFKDFKEEFDKASK